MSQRRYAQAYGGRTLAFSLAARVGERLVLAEPDPDDPVERATRLDAGVSRARREPTSAALWVA
jgi:hypothetical protein